MLHPFAFRAVHASERSHGLRRRRGPCSTGPRVSRVARAPLASPQALASPAKPVARRSGGSLALLERVGLECAGRRAADRGARDAAGRAPGAAPRPARVRAVRASPLDPRPGQGPGPRGHGRVDRQHRPRLARRPRPPRAAVRRARADLRRRAGRRAAGWRWSGRSTSAANRASVERARRRDQRRLPRRPARPHPRRAAPPARRRAARARLRDALSQGAQLRLLADRRRRGAGLLAARADRARPGRASARRRWCASS